MTTSMTLRIGVAVSAAVLLAGCSATGTPTDRTTEGSPAATPTTTPTREPAVMSRAEAFTTALAAVPATYDRWTGATSGTPEDVELCLGRPAVPGVEDGVLVSTEWAYRDDDDPVSRPLESLRAAVVPIPKGGRDAALAAVRDVAACDGQADGDTTFEATSEIVDGVEITTVANRLDQAKPTAYRVRSAAVVDGL